MRPGLTLGLAVGPAVVLAMSVLVSPPAHADIEDDVACLELETSGTTDTYQTDAVSLPLTSLGVAEAQAAMTAPGAPGNGVTVAVVDSGVDASSALLEVVPGPRFSNLRELQNYHGTAVAGLIAGKPRGDQPTGIAPGARVIDVRVYDDDDASQDENAAPVETPRVVQGLRWVAENAQRLGIGVATVALRVTPSPALKNAVRALHAADVVVVAASGNRPTEEGDPLQAQYAERLPGEDAADEIFPAGYDHVVAVSATLGGHPDEAEGGDASTYVLQSSRIDVAAPTYGAVSLGMNGSTCLLYDVATSWAAAEVSGVVALLRAQFPDDSADQVVARLTETASGAVDDRNVLVGAGVVQPTEALTRTLTPSRKGDVERPQVEENDLPPAAAPRAEADPLAGARENAVWFGLLGGAAVVLALLLRPLLARRRT